MQDKSWLRDTQTQKLNCRLQANTEPYFFFTLKATKPAQTVKPELLHACFDTLDAEIFLQAPMG